MVDKRTIQAFWKWEGTRDSETVANARIGVDAHMYTMRAVSKRSDMYVCIPETRAVGKRRSGLHVGRFTAELAIRQLRNPSR